MKGIINKFVLTKWTLLGYSLIALLVTGIYLAFFAKFQWVDWKRYDSDLIYQNNEAKEILKEGAVSIKGNVWSLNSPLLIGLSIVGILLSILIFIVAWENISARTYAPILVLIGFLAPLLVRNQGNIFWVLVIGYIFIMIGASISVSSLKFLR